MVGAAAVSAAGVWKEDPALLAVATAALHLLAKV
jgi:hypothetical protein